MTKYSIDDITNILVTGDIVSIETDDGLVFDGVYYGVVIDDPDFGDFVYFTPFDNSFHALMIDEISNIKLIDRPL